MRTIYVFRHVNINRSYGYRRRACGWLNPNNWYNAGYIFGIVL